MNYGKVGRVMFCKHCGTEIPDESTFCSKCGKQLQQEENQAKNERETKKEPVKPSLKEGIDPEYDLWVARGRISEKWVVFWTLIIWPYGYYKIGRGMRWWGLAILAVILNFIAPPLGILVNIYAVYEAHQTVGKYKSLEKN